ncbi:energy-coupling factor transporter transmembrane component T [Neobacillus sp. LXY-4]|uniref:energy-coupling factor transporter transmembrane component T n=1 Tax=Neobacillus sp. LXY-4 TaxID=3379826 RepID=UPI003EE0F0DB
MKKRFERFHPLVLFSYYVGVLALLMLLFHPIVLVVGLVIIVIFHFIQDRCRSLRRWFFLMVSTGVIIIILNPLFNQNGSHVLFNIFKRQFTLEATMFGVTTALSIMGVIAIFVSYNEVMTPNKIFYLFSKLLPQFAVLLMLTLRFIPLMKRRLEEISAVQTSKGLSVRSGSWNSRVKSGLLYVQVLLTYSLEEAIQTADSMKARGYGLGTRSTYDYFRFKKADLTAIIYLVLFMILALYGRFLGYGFLTIYPLIETLKLSVMDTAVFGEFLLFLGFPLFVEIGGMLKWRKLN